MTGQLSQHIINLTQEGQDYLVKGIYGWQVNFSQHIIKLTQEGQDYLVKGIYGWQVNSASTSSTTLRRDRTI